MDIKIKLIILPGTQDLQYLDVSDGKVSVLLTLKNIFVCKLL